MQCGLTMILVLVPKMIAAATSLCIVAFVANAGVATATAVTDSPDAAGVMFPRRQLQSAASIGAITEEEFCADKLADLELHMAEVETALGITMNKTNSIIANETWILPLRYDCTCNGGSSNNDEYSVLLVDCSIQHQFTLHKCKRWFGGSGARRLGFFDDIVGA